MTYIILLNRLRKPLYKGLIIVKHQKEELFTYIIGVVIMANISDVARKAVFLLRLFHMLSIIPGL